MAFRTNKMPVLQEKSASGSVASFNTALAMPLPSCNIAVNAWQEGSGDPSPVNVRNIVPMREVNIYQRGINLWDEEWEKGYINSSGGNGTDANSIRSKNFCVCVPSIKYCFLAPKTSYVHFYDRNKNWIERKPASAYVATVIIAPSNAYYFRLSSYGYGVTYNDDVTFNYPSTDTDYHAYTGNTYTIQLGQEVYGAEVDVVNGVATVTHQIVDLGNLLWAYSSSFGGFFYANVTDIKLNSWENCSCESYKNHIITGNLNSLPNYNFGVDDRITRVYFKNYDYTDADDFKIAVTGVKLVYELATPFDIQLTPTQIETLIGNNTIFADTGDVDLTYKDLDIAKRGNFREVFKLP